MKRDSEMVKTMRTKRLAAAALGIIVTCSLAACSSGGGALNDPSDDELYDAAEEFMIAMQEGDEDTVLGYTCESSKLHAEVSRNGLEPYKLPLKDINDEGPARERVVLQGRDQDPMANFLVKTRLSADTPSYWTNWDRVEEGSEQRCINGFKFNDFYGRTG